MVTSKAVDQAMPTTEIARDASEASLADYAYRLLQNDILNRVFLPAEPLRLAALKQRYGLSSSPLREALTRLSSDGLAELASLRGFRVAPISLDEMWDVIEIRTLVESEALRRAVAQGDVDWEARVVASFHALTKAVETPAATEGLFNQALEDRHKAFHFALYSACGSPTLLHIAGQLYTRTERYRRPTLSGELRGPKGPRDVMKEHAGLMDALLKRDADLAVGRLTEHYRHTGELIEAYFLRAAAK